MAGLLWYWDRTRDKASHNSIPIPLGYRSRVPHGVYCLDRFQGGECYCPWSTISRRQQRWGEKLRRPFEWLPLGRP
ncbi:hypothetical protein TNCV_4372821 [Trichonephila clavipes]|nr:hypothetical protein TNCV_4372821 [Trichonephila clavipes]